MTDNVSKNLGKVIQIDENQIREHLGELVRGSVEDTLNQLLDVEADQLCNAARYERTESRRDTRAGHYKRKLHTKAGEVTLNVPKLRQQTFETAIIERYRRRESSVEEALIEMYLAGVSVRRVEDITQALWGTRVSPGTVSNLNKKIYERIEQWRSRSIEGSFPYVYLDGIVLKRTWAEQVRNISVLVAIGVDVEGYRQVLGVVEGAKEDKAGWSEFLRHLKKRGLKDVELVISDACLGLAGSIGDFYPNAKWQRCIVHFYRNVFTVVPRGKVKHVAMMLKAIHASEDRQAAKDKADAVIKKLKAQKLHQAAKKVQDSIDETLTYYDFPDAHWRRIRTNNPLERILREVRRRTRVVGAFPDGNSALMLVAARLRHISGTRWGTRRYLNLELLSELKIEEKESDYSLATA
jgi:putative transposase